MTEFKTVSLEDGEFSVVKIEANRPRQLEVVAIFYGREDADHYALAQKNLWDAYAAAEPKRNGSSGAHKTAAADETLTEKQKAILSALRLNPKGYIARDLADMAEVNRTSIYPILKALKAKGKISEDVNGIYQAL